MAFIDKMWTIFAKQNFLTVFREILSKLAKLCAMCICIWEDRKSIFVPIHCSLVLVQPSDLRGIHIARVALPVGYKCSDLVIWLYCSPVAVGEGDLLLSALTAVRWF